MSTPRLRRNFRGKLASDQAGIVALLSDREAELADPMLVFALTDGELAAAWAEHRETVLTAWIRHSPGCRPSLWWRFDSPGLRLRTGGTGQSAAEKYRNWAANFAFGLPYSWCDGTPTFETQAQFLARHGLLLPGEGVPVREPRPLPGDAEWWQAYRA